MTDLSGEGGLQAYLETRRAEVEAALERSVAALEAQVSAEVGAAVRHGVMSGGKRLRPILCVAAHEACGSTPSSAAYDLAASLELIHAYSLMHDDLPCMDDADLRRGRSTTHREHGEDVTMRAGAALIPAAALQALRACAALGRDGQSASAVTRVLLEAAGACGMVGGQWLDLLGEGRALSADELDELHRRKTGALIAAAPVMGGLASGASESVLAALREYGLAIGLAFQITDDVLDATQTAETLGKHPSDAELEKSTYVALHGLEEARLLGEKEAARAVSALDAARLDAPVLTTIALYVVERDR